MTTGCPCASCGPAAYGVWLAESDDGMRRAERPRAIPRPTARRLSIFGFDYDGGGSGRRLEEIGQTIRAAHPELSSFELFTRAMEIMYGRCDVVDRDRDRLELHRMAERYSLAHRVDYREALIAVSREYDELMQQRPITAVDRNRHSRERGARAGRTRSPQTDRVIRHQASTGFRLCSDYEDALAFVFSQDRGVKAVERGGPELLMGTDVLPALLVL